MGVRANSFEVYDDEIFFGVTDLQIRPGTKKEKSSADNRYEESKRRPRDAETLYLYGQTSCCGTRSHMRGAGELG